MTTQPNIRVVIPIYGEVVYISECLNAVFNSYLKECIEIIVVNNGTSEAILESIKKFPISIVKTNYIYDAAKARNRGADGFNGDVLVFIDSDVIVEHRAISSLVSPIQSGLADATVGSYSDDCSNMNFWQKYKQAYLRRVYGQKKEFIQNQFWTALGAISTKTFNSLGGFQSVSGGALGEDTLIGMKLTQHGARILSVPNSCGIHRKEYSFSTLIVNDYKKGVNSFSILAAKPTALKEFRHSTPRNMLAVGQSWILMLYSSLLILLFSLNITILPISYLLLLMATLIVVYLYFRFDFLNEFSRKGLFFLFKALFMMFLLDLVRGLSVITGITQIKWSSKLVYTDKSQV